MNIHLHVYSYVAKAAVFCFWYQYIYTFTLVICRVCEGFTHSVGVCCKYQPKIISNIIFILSEWLNIELSKTKYCHLQFLSKTVGFNFHLVSHFFFTKLMFCCSLKDSFTVPFTGASVIHVIMSTYDNPHLPLYDTGIVPSRHSNSFLLPSLNTETDNDTGYINESTPH